MVVYFAQKPPIGTGKYTNERPGILVVSMYCSMYQSSKGVGTHPRVLISKHKRLSPMPVGFLTLPRTSGQQT